METLNFFDIVAGVLQGDTLAPFLFVITLDYVLRTSLEKSKDLGFTLSEQISRRYPAKHITDADYADDLALFANTIASATTLLHRLENAAQDVGLYVNAGKTEFIKYNQQGSIHTLSGDPLKAVDTFVYLGSEIASTEKDIKTRIAKAWGALNKLNVVWKSSLSDELKRSFFRATIESVLLYGATAWTLTKTLEARLDGTYTHMLRAVLNISWKKHPTKKQLYGNLPTISDIIRERRMRFAGHCWRAKQELASDVLLWVPRHSHTRVGRPATTYVDQLCSDTGCLPTDLPNLGAGS